MIGRWEIFLVGIFVGLVLSEYMGRMEYRRFVSEIPEFLKEKE
jgi:hypothetical protein